MRAPSGGWSWGTIGEFFNCEIKVLSANNVVPPPAMNPEFLSLIFAHALASGYLFGPYWSMILFPTIILGCIAFCVLKFLWSCIAKPLLECLCCCGGTKVE